MIYVCFAYIKYSEIVTAVDYSWVQKTLVFSGWVEAPLCTKAWGTCRQESSGLHALETTKDPTLREIEQDKIPDRRLNLPVQYQLSPLFVLLLHTISKLLDESDMSYN